MGMDPPILEGTQEFSIGKPPYSGSPAPLLWVPKSLSSSRPFRRDWFSHLVPYKFMTSHRAPILGTVGTRQAGLREKEGTNIDTTELEEREDNYKEREPPPPTPKIIRWAKNSLRTGVREQARELGGQGRACREKCRCACESRLRAAVGIHRVCCRMQEISMYSLGRG